KGREEGDLDRLRTLARESGVAKEVEKWIRERALMAAAALKPLPPSPYKEALEALALREAERLS
ncbi:MAG: polyprenyl synthetase family protein, partial [Thermus sp.]